MSVGLKCAQSRSKGLTDGRLNLFNGNIEGRGCAPFAPNALLRRDGLVRGFLECEGPTLCWAVRGEKRVLGAGSMAEETASLRMSGAYTLGDGGPLGFLKCMLDDRGTANPGASPSPLAIVR